jgi:phenylcoumaran benzylic ether reductase
LVATLKSVDVVISAVGYALLADQTRIIDAIKEAGNIKVTFVYLNMKSLLVYTAQFA